MAQYESFSHPDKIMEIPAALACSINLNINVVLSSNYYTIFS